MLLFRHNMNRDKETVQIWKDRCKKVENENNRLRNELEAVRKYKEDYEDLIGSLSILKRRYESLLNRSEELEQLYRDELDSIHEITKESVIEED